MITESSRPSDVTSAVNQERFRHGASVMDSIVGPQGREVIERLRGVAPDLGHHVAAYVFGDIYDRGGLDPRQRQLVIISILTALGGAEAQLKWHIGAGLNVGLTRAEIVEALTQSTVYCGFPRALNAVFAAAEVFNEMDRPGKEEPQEMFK